MMAEGKGANIARLVSKQAGRAKEKLLQNLGKADKTTDEIFDEHLQNFNKQQGHATRLHKDISNYIRCIKAMQAASKNLTETISEVYENEWTGHDMLYVQGQNHEMLWADLDHKLSDQVLIPLNTYQGQFPEMRKKIEKRGRKLIDFDKERHNLQQLGASPNRNEAKFSRGKESMEFARRTYELLNFELHDELPALHDSRVLFLVTNMQTLFAAEQVFHSETAKVYSELEAVVDRLAKDVQKGTMPKKFLPKPRLTQSSPSNIIIPTNSHSPSKGESNHDRQDGGFHVGGTSSVFYVPTPLSPIHEPSEDCSDYESGRDDSVESNGIFVFKPLTNINNNDGAGDDHDQEDEQTFKNVLDRDECGGTGCSPDPSLPLFSSSSESSSGCERKMTPPQLGNLRSLHSLSVGASPPDLTVRRLSLPLNCSTVSTFSDRTMTAARSMPSN